MSLCTQPIAHQSADAHWLSQVVGPVERRAIERLFKQFDDDGNGEIDFGEFIGSARALSRQVAAQEDFLSPDTEDAVSQAFELIDGDDRFPGDGMINMGQVVSSQW